MVLLLLVPAWLDLRRALRNLPGSDRKLWADVV